MPDEKKAIPCKVQKGNRPKIEEVVNYCLDGELKDAALDFAAYMRENKMPFKLHTSNTRAQRAKYDGVPICGIIMCIYGEGYRPDGPPYWTVSPILTHMDQYEDVIRNENLQLNFGGKIWWCIHGSHGSGRGTCDPGKACAGGRDLTIFGNGFDGICMGLWPPVENPGENEIGIIKRLLELERKARDEEKSL